MEPVKRMNQKSSYYSNIGANKYEFVTFWCGWNLVVHSPNSQWITGRVVIITPMSVFYYDIEGDIIDEYNNITFFNPLAMAMDIVSYIRTLSSTLIIQVVNEKNKNEKGFCIRLSHCIFLCKNSS